MLVTKLQNELDTLKVEDITGDVSIQIAIEMPYAIRAIECPTHGILIKVCKLCIDLKYLTAQLAITCDI